MCVCGLSGEKILYVLLFISYAETSMQTKSLVNTVNTVTVEMFSSLNDAAKTIH